MSATKLRTHTKQSWTITHSENYELQRSCGHPELLGEEREMDRNVLFQDAVNDKYNVTSMAVNEI
jgi:hypothetical protein